MVHKILVIEDNEQNLYLVTFILKKNGYEVSYAMDGQAGVEKAFQVRPDLIVLDIQMPVMDGYTVARILRRSPFFVDLPIVAVSSYAMPGDREKALQSGCTGYIEKPIDPETFMQKLASFFPPSHPPLDNELAPAPG